MVSIKPPNRITMPDGGFDDAIIFLAGSIEMGAAENWQKKIEKELEGESCIVLNPRREDWDSSMIQSADSPEFAEQVAWEMDGLEDSDLIVFYFDPATKSPISLMELGFVSSMEKRIVVCCPDGFWRKGNVDIMCFRSGIDMVNSFEELVKYLHRYFRIIKSRK